MEHSNITPFDQAGLSNEDKNKLRDYETIDYRKLKVGSHFRYTSNKYQETGRKLAYGVVKEVDKKAKTLTVNGYNPRPKGTESKGSDDKYPDWTIDCMNSFKEYIFYVKPTATE